jgi:hypothetical protein
MLQFYVDEFMEFIDSKTIQPYCHTDGSDINRADTWIIYHESNKSNSYTFGGKYIISVSHFQTCFNNWYQEAHGTTCEYLKKDFMALMNFKLNVTTIKNQVQTEQYFVFKY